MASGQIFSLRPVQPGTVFATWDTLVGAATPAESVPVADFDPGATIEYLDFIGVLQGYGGGGLTLTLKWSASSATTGSVVWGAAIRRVADDAEDVNTTAHSYDFNDASASAAPSAVGEISYDSITFTDGADMDSLADGEAFILRMRRDGTNGSDDMSGDAELWIDAVVLRET